MKHFAISETEHEQTYKVLPDTGLVIGFQYKGKLAYLENEKQVPLSTAGITGLRDRYRIFRNSPGIGTVLVFFHEGGAAAFFREPLHELFGESLSLEHFMLRSELLLLEEQLCEARTDNGKIKRVEQFLQARLRPFVPDHLVIQALALIHRSKGNIRIKALAMELNTSQSPLEKRFRQVVGTTPKKFASIVRFKHTLDRYHPQDTLTNLGYETGFYDQAHFIKTFRDFTGETPEDFFGRKK